jgi:outer membrane protein OmpA-like peptidoglycan-associated protein/tetratricopeptide (TPR) repeat protein
MGLLMVLSFPALAQKEMKAADLHFQKYEYALAAENYKKVFDGKKPDLAVARRIADCYRLMNNTKEAETWYAQVVSSPAPEPAALLHYADAVRRNGNYLKAKQLYLDYAERVPAEEARAQQLIATCENAQGWMARPETYEITRVEALNSGHADFSPVYYQQGLVFTSDRPAGKTGDKQVSGWTGNPYAKLFYSKGEGDSWSAPEALPEPLNTHLQNGSAVFSADQQTVFFTRINKIKVKNKNINNDPFSWVKFTAANEYVNRLELYVSRRQDDDKWTEPVAFPYNKVSDYSVGHPALSPDGTRLYFVSDMPGGLGETDLYYSIQQADGTWGQPVNLGPQVNTAGKEMFPAMTPQGVLHFSSTGHPGMGGLDVFAAEGAENTWKNVRNLKYPLNSPQDDFGILFDKTGDAGFVSSNRESADGTDDIYAFKYVRVPCQLAGQTVEKMAGKPGVFKITPVARVLVKLYHQGDTTAQTTYSDAEGNFTFPILDGLTYTLKASKSGYLTRSAQITPDCQSTVDMVSLGMVLNRNTLNRPIIIENIYYDLDKYHIRPDAAVELDKLVQTLKDNPTIKIELSSHTDSRQTHSYNQLLSQLRAEAAVTYMVSKGIDQTRLVAKGYGENRLLNKCADNVNCPETDHQLNRRTEFKLLTK